MVRRKRTVFCMLLILNVFVCLLMNLSWTFKWPKNEGRKVIVPTGRFWRPQVLSTSFWNKEQQRLDFIYNPLVNWTLSGNSELPDWLRDTGPLDPCKPDYRVPRQIVDYNTLPQRFQDFLLYMRCRTYPMLINQPHVCHQSPFLLFVIKSLIPHFDRRQAIRESWGRAGVLGNQTVATVFLLGSTLPMDHFPQMIDMLGHEAELHNDVLQWDYRDTFFNLTLKEVLFLEWFSQKCPHARYVLQGDDDVFINTFQIIDYLNGLSGIKAKDLFVGDVISHAGPHRDHKLKYFIPKNVFDGVYPPYAGGGGYLFSGQLALHLYNVSRQVLLYPIDDVYMGMCLRKLGLAPEKHSGFRTFGIEEKYRNNPCTYRNLMLVHSRTPQEILRIWQWITNPEPDCQ